MAFLVYQNAVQATYARYGCKSSSLPTALTGGAFQGNSARLHCVMNTIQIQACLQHDPETKKLFAGVYASDLVPVPLNHGSDELVLCVANLQPSSMPGKPSVMQTTLLVVLTFQATIGFYWRKPRTTQHSSIRSPSRSITTRCSSDDAWKPLDHTS